MNPSFLPCPQTMLVQDKGIHDKTTNLFLCIVAFSSLFLSNKKPLFTDTFLRVNIFGNPSNVQDLRIPSLEIFQRAVKFNERTAIIDSDGKYSYADLLKDSEKFGNQISRKDCNFRRS